MLLPKRATETTATLPSQRECFKFIALFLLHIFSSRDAFYICDIIKQFVVANCSKEQPVSIVKESLKKRNFDTSRYIKRNGFLC